MGTTRLLTRGVLTLGLIAMLSSYGLAAERGKATNSQSYTGTNGAMPQASSTTAMDEATLKRASRVMYAKVKSPQGKTLGQVHDLVLTPDLNGISYVALSRGGILGIGNTLYAIPWSALNSGVNGTYVVPITEEQLKQSRGFRPAYWPSEPERRWVVQGRESVSHGQTIAESRNVHGRRFTRIKETTVKAADGRNAGKIQDLVVAMDSGRIAYTIVSYGGLLGLGSRFAAVPQSAITLEPALEIARVDAAPATVRAHSFAPGQWPDLASPSYSQQLARAFSRETSGTVLGYVPPEGPVAAAPAPAPRTPQRPETRSTTPPAPAPTLAEPTSAELTGTFNPASITTMEGTVADAGKFKASSTGPDMLWLRVRTSSGQTILVSLGPRDYVSGQDFYIVRGDRVRLAGSDVAATASGKRLFLPTEITYNNHVLRLRSATGTPLWEGQMTSPTWQQPGATTDQTSIRRSTDTSTSTPSSQTRSGTMSTPETSYRTADEPNEPNKP